MAVTYSPVEEHDIELEQQQQQQQQQQNGDEDNIITTSSSSSSSASPSQWTVGLAFWLLGVFNNSSYVIMIASAKTISEGGTALVFLANVVPSMLIKASAPYWFDRVDYETRMLAAFGCMVLSFAIVGSLSPTSSDGDDIGDTSGEATANSSSTTTTLLQLLGVALGSAQSGLGEASLLAAAGTCDDSSGHCISCFSSGTGLAGVFGFLWKWYWNELCQYSLSTTLWLAQVLALAYIGVFYKYLHPHLLLTTAVAAANNTADNNADNQQQQQQQLISYRGVAVTTEEELQPLELITYHDSTSTKNSKVEDTNLTSTFVDDGTSNIGTRGERETFIGADILEEDDHNNEIHQQQQQARPQFTQKAVHQMSIAERAHFVAALWPYIIPLFVVYATEYSLQAGTWTAIGFPVDSQEKRDEFYEFSNWMYQLGVCVSRSSGSLGTAPMAMLWAMPGLQAVNVVLFAMVAAHHIWYSYGQLLPLSFYVGCLGGAVYVHGYKRICADFGVIDRREFALAATSVAESLGIVCADIMGLFIQACLYRTNEIGGAIVSCPIPAGQ